MANPTPKFAPIEAFLEEQFGRTTSIKADLCVFCREAATDFRDALSRREFSISGICQRCQDNVFGTEDN